VDVQPLLVAVGEDGRFRKNSSSAYPRRHFQMMAGERCGDHFVASYVLRVNAMKRQLQRLAANDGN
jgi:hypothetical protein